MSDSDKPCSTCGHPQHKHGDQIETYGCYAWDNPKTHQVCICEEFTTLKPIESIGQFREFLFDLLEKPIGEMGCESNPYAVSTGLASFSGVIEVEFEDKLYKIVVTEHEVER